ncbi:MAG: hypothetical protein A2020_13190 [Lentisphaerae bacterium GWF2_45_14]|nr:MAG: hypothetical protein A2020_13190 [Lentisphaerae bacterium GWF2_45_14]
MFDLPTYIVLDVPPPASDYIKAMRRRFDPERADVPVEITIAGSSGLGTIAAGQRPDLVFRTIADVASKFSPFVSSFLRVKKFRGTGIIYFEPANPLNFIQIHFALESSGILFNPNPFPFTPHCTIRLKKGIRIGEIRESLLMTPPECEFSLKTISVYSYENEKMKSKLLYRSYLGC